MKLDQQAELPQEHKGRGTVNVSSKNSRLRLNNCTEKKTFPSKYSESAKSEVRSVSLAARLKGDEGGGWVLLLHVVIVSVRWWRRRWRWRQPLVVPLLRPGSVGQHEGVGGVSADAERSQAAQVAGRPRQPHLCTLRRSHHAAVELGLRQPRRDLDLRQRVQVRHEGWVLDTSWIMERK